MNKLIGYASITIGEEIIPIKIGVGAMTEFLAFFGIELHEIMTKLFTIQTLTDPGDGLEKAMPVPNDPFKFAASLLMHGANYCCRLEGRPEYILEHAYEWIDELGGINAEPLKLVYTQFFKAVRNGGTPPKAMEFQTEEKKSEENQ